MLAFEMNGEPLPMLNGFPLRLVVPGFYGTYWVKHLNELTVVGDVFDGFYMSTAYRDPGECGALRGARDDAEKHDPDRAFHDPLFPHQRAGRRAAPRPAVRLCCGASPSTAAQASPKCSFPTDAGQSWHPAQLGKDLGRYSFREWTLAWTPTKAGAAELRCRAFNRIGESQPLEPLWNPSGYLRNVVETTKVTVA